MTSSSHTPDASAKQSVEVFIQKFINPAPGKTCDDARARLLHWLAVANTPACFTADHAPKALANLRRKARQNVRRLAFRHPEVAVQIAKTVSAEVSI